MALLAAALVSPLFLKFRTPRPAADAQAQLGTDGAGTTVNELGIAPFPTATLPVTRERLEERTDRP